MLFSSYSVFLAVLQPLGSFWYVPFCVLLETFRPLFVFGLLDRRPFWGAFSVLD